MIGTLGLLLWTVAAQAKGLELASQYESVLEPLTTEKVWTLDPEELNPHRQRWVLHRQVRLKGLEARKLGAERFGVRAKVLESVTRGYVRGDGPWYRPFSEFPCGEEQAWFATKEGAREALEAGAAAWSELLKRELVTLDLRLERIAEKSGPNAVRFALVAYEDWLRRLEGEWRGELKARIRQSEWTRYREVGTDAGICAKGGAARAAAQPPVVVPSWENLMEPPGAPAQAQARSGPAKPLARTPARRWNGLYSVRLSVQVGTRSLTGQFLLDSTTYRSILNPAWLAMQGMLPVWIEIPGARPERVTMSGTTALGPRALVDRVKFGGHELELTEFVLYDTDLYAPPDFAADCCDGVLGRDFLQRYVVEVRPGPPAELLLWPREGFTPPNGIAPPGKTTNGMSEALWIEAALGADGPVSACEVDSRRWKVRWDTGAEAALIVRSPEALGRAKKTGDWTLRCAGHTIATQLEPLSPDSEAPGTDLIVGMPLLSRGPVFFDLPHGRVWFRKQGLLAELPENRSGLELRYVDKRGERQLVVAAIRKGSPAEALRKAGLKPGDVIEELDSRPATELDLWEVERRLGGVYGDTVTLLWGSEKSVKVVPLKVR